jgi:hypothetical protein
VGEEKGLVVGKSKALPPVHPFSGLILPLPVKISVEKFLINLLSCHCVSCPREEISLFLQLLSIYFRKIIVFKLNPDF